MVKLPEARPRGIKENKMGWGPKSELDDVDVVGLLARKAQETKLLIEKSDLESSYESQIRKLDKKMYELKRTQ